MKIEDFGGLVEVRRPEELVVALNRRFGGRFNEFWLFHGSRFPTMSIWVAGDVATLHYFPVERDPGFRSVCEDERSVGITAFRSESLEHTENVPNAFVVPFGIAVAAATEFLANGAQPTSTKWLQL